jgi:hypothetical protein
LGGDGRFWDANVEGLAKHFTVVVHDHRIEELLGYRPITFAAAARRALAARADRLRRGAGERAPA